MNTLYHYTCDHARREIGDHGTLRPWAHGVVWLTDLDIPMREALGLTSYMLHCDRTQHRYRVTDTSNVVPWVKFARRDRSIEIDGTKPMHWWVSEEPVPVVYDPDPLHLRSMDDLLTTDQRDRLNNDLAEMAKRRRRAEVEARDWPMT